MASNNETNSHLSSCNDKLNDAALLNEMQLELENVQSVVKFTKR